MLTNVDIFRDIGSLPLFATVQVSPKFSTKRQHGTKYAPLVQNLYKSCTVWGCTKPAQKQHRTPIQKPDKYPTKSRQKNEAVRIAESKVDQNAVKNQEREPQRGAGIRANTHVIKIKNAALTQRQEPHSDIHKIIISLGVRSCQTRNLWF